MTEAYQRLVAGEGGRALRSGHLVDVAPHLVEALQPQRERALPGEVGARRVAQVHAVVARRGDARAPSAVLAEAECLKSECG